MQVICLEVARGLCLKTLTEIIVLFRLVSAMKYGDTFSLFKSSVDDIILATFYIH